MSDRVLLTVPELAGVLQPALTEDQVRAMVKLARIRPAGHRSTGKPGHPWPEYDYAEIAPLHKALTPWLLAGHGIDGGGQ